MQHFTPICGAVNIGPMIAARLEAVGIKTIDELRRLGAAEAYKRIQASYPQVAIAVCFYLYSLQGAIDGVEWNGLSPDVKEKLLLDAGVSQQTSGNSRSADANR